MALWEGDVSTWTALDWIVAVAIALAVLIVIGALIALIVFAVRSSNAKKKAQEEKEAQNRGPEPVDVVLPYPVSSGSTSSSSANSPSNSPVQSPRAAQRPLLSANSPNPYKVMSDDVMRSAMATRLPRAQSTRWDRPYFPPTPTLATPSNVQYSQLPPSNVQYSQLPPSNVQYPAYEDVSLPLTL